ncbi:MAG: chloride channel protein [Thermonemataceae bacterium]
MAKRIPKQHYTALTQYKRISIQRLRKRLTNKQFLILAAIGVGLLAGLQAVLLKSVVHGLHHYIHYDHEEGIDHLWKALFPIVGIALTVLFVKYLLKTELGKGVANILREIVKGGSNVRRHKTFSHMVTSALTVGFGGSAGLEAPIVITGAASGSNVGRALHVNYKEKTLLLGCGAAAGIAAVFNSPIAGVMFAIEVLLTQITVSSFIPLIIAAACGALVSNIILHENILFAFRLQQPFEYTNIPYYILLAFLCGAISLYYMHITHKIEHLFKQSNRVWLRVILGGLCLALLIIVFPPLFGEGYRSIKLLADGKAFLLLEESFFQPFAQEEWLLLGFVGAIMLLKAIATSITLASGGNGGNFAPALFVGAYLGFVLDRVVNLLGLDKLPETNFTIVGMTGVLAGVMYAPLTGIFLIAEITGGYELIIPLMLVATLAHAMVRHFEPYSMEIKQQVEEGEIFTHDKDTNVLLLLDTSQLIETDVKTIHPDKTLGDLVALITKSRRSLFAVVDAKGHFKGVITLDDVKNFMFDQTLYDQRLVKEVMQDPPARIYVNERMDVVMRKFDETNAWNLPVVEGQQYIGFISKARIFSQYRSELRNITNLIE